MKTNALILLVAIALGFGLTYWLQASPGPSGQAGTAPQVTQGSELPAFAFTTRDGRNFKTPDFTGKWVMINFWATWCPPCIAEFPMLLELARHYPDRLVLLAVSSDYDAEAIDRFFARLDEQDAATLKQENVMIVHDTDTAITFDIFQTVRLPETIIVNPELQMVKKLVGVDWHPDDIKELIDPGI